MKLIVNDEGYFLFHDDSYFDLTCNSHGNIREVKFKELPDNVNGIKVGDLVKLNPMSCEYAEMIKVDADVIYRVEKIDVFKKQLKIKGFDCVFHASHFEVVKIYGE